MSFKRLEADDFVISADSISSTLWSTNTQQLSTFYTSSIQANGSSRNYYLNIFATSSNTASAEFAITYGNSLGSGSQLFNASVDGKSPSSTIYGQYQNLIIGDEKLWQQQHTEELPTPLVAAQESMYYSICHYKAE